jgi:hypothetical protein
MTEAEWLACEDPAPMLAYLRGRASDRKLRLFACACCRELGRDVEMSAAARTAVEVVERYVDGAATRGELDAACAAAMDATYAPAVRLLTTLQPDSVEERRAAMLARVARWAASEARPGDAMRAADVANDPTCWEQVGVPDRQARVLPLLRDIFGDPFRPASCLNDAWRTATVAALAQAAYDCRALPEGALEAPRLAVLADALEDAGCTDADILGHLRGPGQHVRGCFVLDLILLKS